MLKILLKTFYFLSISTCLTWSSLDYIPGKLIIEGQSPSYQLTNNVHKYSCKFRYRGNCFWTYDDDIYERINLTWYKYTYISNNGVNTIDCSIIANSKDTKQLSIDEITCWGSRWVKGFKPIPFVTIRTDLDKPLILNCSSNRNISCFWETWFQTISIKDHYEYLHNGDKMFTQDCSIRINNFKELGIGIWECKDKENDEIIAKYIILDSSINDVDHEISPKTTITTTEEPLITTTFEPTPSPQPTYATVFPMAGIIYFSVATIVTFTIVLRRRIARKKQRTDNHN